MKTNQNDNESVMITCQELATFIDDYLDNNLPTSQYDFFISHLDDCPACDNYLNNYRKAVNLGKKAYNKDDKCEQIPEPLIQAILKASKQLS